MRNNRIDILRFIGLATIILAHVQPPMLLLNLRNFDVPLMVLVSGMSFDLSYKPSEPYLLFIWKRFKRLVAPTWIFLTIYFSTKFLFQPGSEELQFKTIFESYALIGGIGFVWIIRIFILVAMMSPIMIFYNKKIASNFNFILMLSLAFIPYEIFRYVAYPYMDDGFGRIASLLCGAISYSLLFALGLRIPSMSRKELLYLLISSFLLFAFIFLRLFLIYDKFIFTLNFKYPPSIYYFSYAVFVSLILWICSAKTEVILKKIKLKQPVLFVAQNSLWIYLWHIPFAALQLPGSFILRYIVIFLSATFLAFCQVWIVEKVLIERIKSTGLRKNIKILLTG